MKPTEHSPPMPCPGTRLLVLSALTLLGAGQLLAEPPHPVLTISTSANYTAANTILSTWTESEYIEKFTPKHAPRDARESQAPLIVPGDTSWSWNISNPDKITSMPSGTVFPNSNYTVSYANVNVLSGKTVSAPFYTVSGQRSLVFNAIAQYQRNQLRSHLQTLTAAYVNSGSTPATRNDAYARRIAVALLEWSKYFPDYVATNQNSTTFFNLNPSTRLTTTGVQRASSHNGVAHEWGEVEVLAFDAIYDSQALVTLSGELGYDVREYITNNYFYFGGNYIVNNIPVSVAIQTNLSTPFTVLALVARVLNRPDYIVWMDQYVESTVRQKIGRDGLLKEGMSYSLIYINENVKGAQNTRDYFLTRPADTPTLANISARAQGAATMLNQGQQMFAKIALPNGQLPGFGDTGFNFSPPARNAGNSAVSAAYGSVSMGAGTTANDAVQVNQNFPGSNLHMRSDITAYTLWAFGNEYLGNIRYYNQTAGRQFTNQLLAHNAAVIDRTNPSSPSGNTNGNGDLTLFETGQDGLAVTEIDGQRNYSNKASRYQRIMMLNSHDISSPYVVDVLRVTGGQTHDFTFHGPVRYDSTWECSFPLTPNPASRPMLAPGETWSTPSDQYASFYYYGVWQNVSNNPAPGNFQITYRDNSNLNRDVRLWMTDEGTSNVYIGRTPVPARDNSMPDTLWTNNLWRPSAIIRRTGGSSLGSLFVSVVEPMNNGVSTIANVERIPMAGGALDSCALRITFANGREDVCVVNLHNPVVNGASTGSTNVTTSDGNFALDGRIGVFSDGPAGSRVWTVAAKNFTCRNSPHYPSLGNYKGTIDGGMRVLAGGAHNAFTTTTPLPLGTELRGKHLSLNFGSMSGTGTTTFSEMFEIDQVIFADNKYRICLTADPQLNISNNGASMTEQVSPLRTFTGSNSFEIYQSDSQDALPASPPPPPPPTLATLFGDDLSNLNQFTNTTYSTLSAWSSSGGNAIYTHDGGGAGRARLESQTAFDFNPYASGEVTLEFISTVSSLLTRYEVGLIDATQISNYDNPLGRESIFGFAVCHTGAWNLPGLLFNGGVSAPHPVATTSEINGIAMSALTGTHTYKVVFKPTGTEFYRDGSFIGSTSHTLDFSRSYKVAAFGQGAYVGTSFDDVRIYGQETSSPILQPKEVRLNLTQATPGNEILIQTENGIPGTKYILETSTTLGDPSNPWTPAVVGIIPGDEAQFSDTVDAVQGRRFYRLKLLNE